MPKAPSDEHNGSGKVGIDPALAYEDAVSELEAIVEEIESGDIGLEQSIRRYERGAALLRHCRAILDQAEQRITELDASTLNNGDDA
tara:strand:- start:893 stop:1153 length:261 start_codon:yes stop_codon:yes gene_type:complete